MMGNSIMTGWRTHCPIDYAADLTRQCPRGSAASDQLDRPSAILRRGTKVGPYLCFFAIVASS